MANKKYIVNGRIFEAKAERKIIVNGAILETRVAAEAAAAAYHTFELPKLAHPDFSVPNRKPVGPVEIDRDHPLAKGLKHLWVPQMGDDLIVIGAGRIRDRVGSLDWDTTETAAGRESIVRVINGRVVLDVNETTPGRSDYQWLNGSLSFTDDEPFTVMSKQYSPTGGFKIEALGLYNSTGCIWNRRASYFRIYNEASNFTIGSPMTAISGEVTTGYTSSGGGTSASNVRSYQHESNETYTGTGKSTGWTIPSPYGNQQTELDQKNKEYIAVWDRELSLAELRIFGNDPYQILKPANPLVYFFAAEEVAAAFKAYWARNSNTIIQQVTR